MYLYKNMESSSSSPRKKRAVRHGDWVQKKDPHSGRFYYGNVKTLERVWVMPPAFKAAAAAAAAASTGIDEQ